MIERRSLLVVACARSGTLFLSRCFQAAGLPLLHENVGSAGSVSCYLAVDGLCPRPSAHQKNRHRDGTSYDMFQWAHIFHQVRHPLKVVASVETIMEKSDWIWMSSFLPIDPKWSRLKRAIHYVRLWNELCAKRSPELTYRLEDVATRWPELLQRAGFPDVPFPAHVSVRTHASSGFRKAKLRTWEELLEHDREGTLLLQDQAVSYGYEVSSADR